MLRTLLTLTATLLIGAAILYSVRGTVSTDNAEAASATPCPCGQCDVGCDCCLNDDVSCDNCVCDACGCDVCDTSAKALVAASGESACCSADKTACCSADKASCCSADKASCCAADGLMAKSAASDESLTTTESDACPCGQCDLGCKCCTDENVSCEDCGCESCGCTACAEPATTDAI